MFRRALPLLALTLLAVYPVQSAPFRRLQSSGFLDFRRGVAEATGIGPRARNKGEDPALQNAHLNLKALLYPHPVDDESTLGDLVAFHQDLASAIELQLGQAKVRLRQAIPPDLEEVRLELPLRELIVALLPFTASPAPRQPAPSPANSNSAKPERILLQLPRDLARRHVPALLPSLRGLSGLEIFPGGGEWIRRAYESDLVQYPPAGVISSDRDWVVPVVSVGGLAGATLFLRDQDAEKIRGWQLQDSPPPILVVDAKKEKLDEEVEGLASSPSVRAFPESPGPSSGRWTLGAPASPEEIVVSPPTPPESPTSLPPMLAPDSPATASPVPSLSRPDEAGSSDEIEQLLLDFRRRARSRDQEQQENRLSRAPEPLPSLRPAPRPPLTGMPEEALDELPSSGGGDPLDELLYQREPVRDPVPPPTSVHRDLPTRTDEGEPPATTEAATPAIRWQFFRQEDEEAGELP